MSKVLAIRFSALGDIAMAIPVLVSAARLSPDDEFTVLSRDYVAPLFAGLAPNIRFHGVDLKRQRYAGLTGMMNLERRSGRLKPVIKKMLVDLNGAPFRYFAERRERWAVETCYTFPGAIQYYGPSCVCDTVTKTLELEHMEKRG